MTTLTLDVRNAPERFRTMSGVGDNGLRYAPGRNQPGKCTRWVWLALGAFTNTTPLPHAVAAWDNAPAARRHGLTEKPFAGAIAVFGATNGPRWAGDVNWRYGDVAMFNGSGLGSNDWRDWGTRATDASGVGFIADVTLGTRYVQTGYRPLLGWLDSYGGAVLVNGTTDPEPPQTEKPVENPYMEDEEMGTFRYKNKRGVVITKYKSGAKSVVLNQFSVGTEVFTVKEQIDLLKRYDRSTYDAGVEEFNAVQQAVLDRILKGVK